MSKFQFGNVTQTSTGSGAINQIGENNATANVGNAGDSLSIEQVFAAIVAAVEAPSTPAEQSNPAPSTLPSTPTPDAPVPSSPVAEDTVAPLQSLACMPLANQSQPDIQAKAANLLERLIPYAPQIGKGLAVFGAAALESLANRNPIIAGVCAVCKATKDNSIA